ncbi:MAG: HPr kinase/phosphorylase [Dehalococcoidia bacterium]
MYEVELITIEERDAIISKYEKLITWQRKANINGACIKFFTNNKLFKEMWEDNFWFMSDDVRPHARVFALEAGGELRVYYEPISKTVIILDCDYYGWVKSITLALTADLFEDYHSARRRFSVHGAALDFGGIGITIISPSGTGKTTLALGLLLFEEGSRLVSEDWYFVLPSRKYFVASASEKEIYVRGDIGDIWPQYRIMVKEGVSDPKGRAITDLTRALGEGRTIQQTTIRSAVLLKRDYHDEETVKGLTSPEALEFMKSNDFCNPHQLVRTEAKHRIRTEFFERYFASLDRIYIVNTILKPEETLNRVRGLLSDGGLLG